MPSAQPRGVRRCPSIPTQPISPSAWSAPAPWAAASCRWRPRAACACWPTTRSPARRKRPRPTSPRCSTALSRRAACRPTRPRPRSTASSSPASLEEVAKANLIIEAIIERLDVKQAVFAKLDALAGPDTIIASNTSSIPITAIASACKRPERVGGMHFFNPVPLMRLVEVIPGLKTAPWVTEAMMALGRRMTREPVLCTDSPAFLVNHVGRAFVPESQKILTDEIASAVEIDRILTGAPGFKLGPLRAVRHGRHRRAAWRDGIDLRPLLQRARVRALPALGPARRRRPLRPEDGRRLVHLRQRQARRAAARARARRAAEVGVGQAQRAPPRAAGAADRPLQASRRRRSRRRTSRAPAR